jgi:hypothetical protein
MGKMQKIKKAGTNPILCLESTTSLWNKPKQSQFKAAKLLIISLDLGMKPIFAGSFYKL